eukprot:Clim_evm20s152 gene=Clim_evmTU20s152
MAESDGDTDSLERELFGGSRVVPFDDVPGLVLIRSFLTETEHDQLLQLCHQELLSGHNQAMRFGDLPEMIGSLGDKIMGTPGVFPDDIRFRSPAFDQIIVNHYNPGDGLTAHVDLAKFDDGIAIVSLGSGITMDITNGPPADPQTSQKKSIYLNSGDLLTMFSDARYKCPGISDKYKNWSRNLKEDKRSLDDSPLYRAIQERKFFYRGHILHVLLTDEDVDRAMRSNNIFKTFVTQALRSGRLQVTITRQVERDEDLSELDDLPIGNPMMGF